MTVINQNSKIQDDKVTQLANPLLLIVLLFHLITNNYLKKQLNNKESKMDHKTIWTKKIIHQTDVMN